MASPQGPVSTDEILVALLQRSASPVESITEEELLNVRRTPSALVVEHDESNDVYTVRLDTTTPQQELRAHGSLDMRPVGPGASF